MSDVLIGLEMDFDYLKLVLNDFNLKELFIIHWLDNNLDKNMQDRNGKILYLLRVRLKEGFNEWTALKVKHALMASKEKQLAEDLTSFLVVRKHSNTIVQPYVNQCCNSGLKISIGRTTNVFGINNPYTATSINEVCHRCNKKYSHHHFTDGKEKFVTNESIFASQLVYLGGDYGYERGLIKWLSNSILYLHSGFENFCKCYNETRNWTCIN